MSNSSLYLIPTPLGANNFTATTGAHIIETVTKLKHFICENKREGFRFIKKCNPKANYDHITLFELNKHTQPKEINTMLQPLVQGHEMGLLSDAGCPAIADPGSIIVAMAHEKGFRVVPLIGPSSIVLALMASGFNGQSFTFHGYLPIDKIARKNQIKKIENESASTKSTHIFIETPFRNDALMHELLATLKPFTKICIACNITQADEWIFSCTVKEWKKREFGLIVKKPTVFLMQAQ